MPPTAPPPGKAPVKGKMGKGLGKKVGPFSLWVYLVAIGGGVAVWWFFLRGKGGDASGGYGGVETVTGSGYSPQDAAMAGAPSANGAPADQLSPDVLASLQEFQDNLQAQVGDIRGHVTELEDAYTAAGYTQNEDKSWNGPGSEPFYGDGGDAGTGPAQAQGSPGTVAGVPWGGQIFKTRQGLATWLQAHGANYAQWAARHPGAAQQLTGPAPHKTPITRGKPPKKGPKHPAQPKPTGQGKKKNQTNARAAAHPAAHPKAQPKKQPVKKKILAKQGAPLARSGGRGRK